MFLVILAFAKRGSLVLVKCGLRVFARCQELTMVTHKCAVLDMDQPGAVLDMDQPGEVKVACAIAALEPSLPFRLQPSDAT